jgi:exonuclease V gamma subunit
MTAQAGHVDAEASAWEKARKEFRGDDQRFAEIDDAWTALAFRDRDPFTDSTLKHAFAQNAKRVFATLARLVQGASQ